MKGDDQYGWYWSPWMLPYSGAAGAFLTERAMRRTARYYREVSDLVRQGSVEPRLWVSCVEGFWSGIADDYGDYLRVSYGWDDPAELVQESPSLQTLRVEIGERAACQELALEVPDAVFASHERDGERRRIVQAKLTTTGFKYGEVRVLRPEVHLRFDPDVVEPARRSTKLRFHHLPEELTAGITLLGTVIAHRKDDQGSELPPVLIAIVQAQVF